MEFKDILYEVKDDYAHVTINRPKVLNAFTPVTLQELKTALDNAEKDKNVGVIILSGAGDRAFCAGGDMNWESSKEFQDHEYEFHIHGLEILLNFPSSYLILHKKLYPQRQIK